MSCTRTSHSNCIHPEGCAWCGTACVGLFCSAACYEADSREFTAKLDAMIFDHPDKGARS